MNTPTHPLSKIAALSLCLLVMAGCKQTQTVPYVDIERYMGTWYQLSAYETSFNEGLVGVTADYTLLADGTVQVYNKGFKDSLDGPIDEILGKAVVVDTETNSRLKVTFPGVPSFPYANYLIVLLDADNYSYAVVTDPFRFTLFVLSRTPQIDQDTYDLILSQLEEQGINTDKLLLTEQPMHF